MNEEDEIYGIEETARFDIDEYDQDYVDGGIRDDVRHCLLILHYSFIHSFQPYHCSLYISRNIT